MASGRPDWHSIITISGKYGDDYKPVLVDSTGQLYIVMTGQELITGDPQTIAVDGSGIMLSRLKGYDGSVLRDVKVDTAGNIIAHLVGYDGSNLKDVKVDSAGNILAIMKGVYGVETLKTIAVDTDGVMKANLSAQDLNWLTVRPAYGQAKRDYKGSTVINAMATATLIDIDGQGVTLGGIMEWNSALDSQYFGINVYLDSALAFTAKVSEMLTRHIDIDGISVCILRAHDTDPDNHYCLAFVRGYTFESKLEIKFTNIHDTTGVTIDLTELYYALVP